MHYARSQSYSKFVVDSCWTAGHLERNGKNENYIYKIRDNTWIQTELTVFFAY